MIGEIGLSAPPVDVELRVLKAAGWAHLETGAPIIIHQSERKEYSIALEASMCWNTKESVRNEL
jgi:predicted metal-dependent phosphotriesterase family hydrolase